jgi:diaminohydroxyphosphoribosylaminopyrimidine deaminase/5-amino-6-(5-phosphoribosylamino)uracil reductase
VPDDLALVRSAVELASREHPHPNPRVGAIVLDRTGREVARAAHVRPGTPHAERLALDAAGEAARGGTLVVTLEPCTHVGRTPPCVDAVISSGVRRVVVGVEDPDERVAGAGLARLGAAGIEVVAGVGAEEVEAADPGYFHHRRTGRPRVTLKSATTIDGQTAAADGSSKWITGEEARLDAHRLRAGSDAVLVGAGTVRADDPLLTVRMPGWTGSDPAAVVVAGTRPLPPGARIWERDPIVLAPGPVSVPSGTLVEVEARDGRVEPGAALSALGDLGFLDVLVEGGAGIAAAFWAAGLVDRGITYLGALVAGGIGRGVFDAGFHTLGDARPVRIMDVRSVGDDLRVEWVPTGSR